MGKPSVIVLELNELSPPLMSRFIAAGELPNFARLQRESETWVTDAEEKPPFLEPWIQWVTVHTGLRYEQHQLFHLGDGHRLEAPRIWDTLSERGYSSWVCGSMNVGYRPGFHGLVMPDPWAKQLSASPELAGYLDFVRANVLEYSNEKHSIGKLDYAKFGLYMAQHGLSSESVLGLGLQLVEERTNLKAKWKRAAALDLLQFDVFKHFYKKTQPDFATFFANSTAHYQHYFWRNLDPDRFKLQPTADDQAEHREAVLFGYRRMDALVGRFIDLAGPGTTLVFATALSQQPYLLFEEDGGKVSYRPREFAPFLDAVGVKQYSDVVPVMTQNFSLRFPNKAASEAAILALSRLTVNGEPMMAINPDPAGDSMNIGCKLHGSITKDAVIEGGPSTVRFFDLLYQIEGVKSGMHHPDGLLWIRRPDRHHETHQQKLPLTRVHPMLLEMFPEAGSRPSSATG